MANNLFVSYDLIKPGQNYERVQNAIRALGRWYKVQYSLFYVNTSLTPHQAHSHVRAVMDPNDKLVVVNARGAIFSPDVPAIDIAEINKVWFASRPALPDRATGTYG